MARKQNKVECIFYKNECPTYFNWIKVIPKLKVYTYVFREKTKKLTDILFLQACSSTDLF